MGEADSAAALGKLGIAVPAFAARFAWAMRTTPRPYRDEQSPGENESVDRLILTARKAGERLSNVVSDAFCSVVRGGAAFRWCGGLAKAEARGQWTPQYRRACATSPRYPRS
jgi:hypothetical protein